MRRPRPAAPSVAVAVVVVLLAGGPAIGAASDPVAPERRASWVRERQRAQAVAELLVRQEWVRRQGSSTSVATTSRAADAAAWMPLDSAPGSDAGLAELFLDDEPRPAEAPEATPLLPVTVPVPAAPVRFTPPAPAATPAVPPALPVVPLLTPPSAPAPGGVELFHLGYSRFSQGDWAGAREAFAAFMAAHPAHDLTDNAAFWLAECAAQDGSIGAALEQFQQVARNFPGGDKVPDAQVRIAALQAQAGRPDDARRVLEGVVRDWPGTAAARRASELLAATPPAAR